MEQLEQYFNHHQYSSRFGSAMVYALASAVALNFFGHPDTFIHQDLLG